MIGLTPRARELLCYLSEREICPTYREMAAALDWPSTASVHRAIRQLERGEYIRRLPGRARAIEVLASYTPPQPFDNRRTVWLRVYGRINLNEYPARPITAPAPLAGDCEPPAIPVARPLVPGLAGGFSQQRS